MVVGVRDVRNREFYQLLYYYYYSVLIYMLPLLYSPYTDHLYCFLFHSQSSWLADRVYSVASQPSGRVTEAVLKSKFWTLNR